MEDKWIQWYDSMGGTDVSKLNGLLRYLKQEYKGNNDGANLDVSKWRTVNTTALTPRQLNGEYLFISTVATIIFGSI